MALRHRHAVTIGAADREAPRPASLTEVHIGFVALTDCAPLILAKERGFFRRHGIRAILHREPSWANIRDKLVAGVLDAAQALAPMTVATTLGLDGMAVPLLVPMALGLNGNAITVSEALYRRMARRDPEGVLQRPISARALKAVIEDDRRAGRPRLRFAAVFPFSAHDYELRYWMASAGIDPARDVEIQVVPPVGMEACFRAGEIDGCCVGEPWNHFAVDRGVGRSLISSYELWNNAPEKVLAVTEEWADANPELLQAVVRALIEAAAWVDHPENRLEATHVIAGESYVDAPVEIVAASMQGRFQIDAGETIHMPDFHVFYRYVATFPWISHAGWFLSQMMRWGQIEKAFDVRRLAARIYRPDLYREAAAAIGVPFPGIDEKPEGIHEQCWALSSPTGDLEMGPDRFFDGRRFDLTDLVPYLEQFEVSHLRVRLDDLDRWNR